MLSRLELRIDLLHSVSDHSVMPLRVQYLRGLGGGSTSAAGASIDAPALQVGIGRLGTGVADIDAATKVRHESLPGNVSGQDYPVPVESGIPIFFDPV